MALNAPYLGPIVTLVGFFGLLFAVHKTANSAWGLLCGVRVHRLPRLHPGPDPEHVPGLANGPVLVTSALATTAAGLRRPVGLRAGHPEGLQLPVGLSGGGLLRADGLGGAVAVFDLSAFHTAIAAGFVLFASAAILWQTSAIVHGGETNYLIATVVLYTQIYNLFLSLLHMFGVMGEDWLTADAVRRYAPTFGRRGAGQASAGQGLVDLAELIRQVFHVFDHQIARSGHMRFR
jgi:modulator of FtsH protease